MNGAMSSLGRVIGWIGWLWVVAGILGPAIGLPQLNVFPGFILVLVGRVFRQRRERQPMESLGVGEAPEVPERPLLTDVRRSAPAPRRAEPLVYRAEPEPEPPSRDDQLEQILSPRPEVEIDEVMEAPAAEVPEDTPLSSAEMIARARDRYNRKGEGPV